MRNIVRTLKSMATVNQWPETITLIRLPAWDRRRLVLILGIAYDNLLFIYNTNIIIYQIVNIRCIFICGHIYVYKNLLHLKYISTLKAFYQYNTVISFGPLVEIQIIILVWSHG